MSQITKPMALDETLQDVVTAIQGITQGGMIVSTGNVGSATQPVYIDGGVPRAIGTLAKANGGTGNTIGKGECVNVNRIANDGDVNIDTYTTDTKATTHFDIAPGSASNVPADIWAVYQTMSGSGTGGDYAAQMAYSVTHDQIWFRRKKTGTWQPWHQIYGITTGTPTSPNSNCSFDSGRTDVKKSGNVVEVNVRLNVDTAFTPNENTQLFILPYKPVSNWVQLGRVSGAMNGTNVTGRVEVNSSSGGVIWGSAPYTQLTAGTKIWVTGTYFTND